MQYIDFLIIIGLAVLSYLVGNISFGRIISKKLNKEDITKKGSGNPGTMNSFRNYGYKTSICVLILDMAKGALPAFVAVALYKWAGVGELGGLMIDAKSALYIVGAASILGHCFPIFFKFKGGKGIATAMGVFMVSMPAWTWVAFFACVLFVIIFQYGGVASLMFTASLSCVDAVANKGNITVLICLGFIVLLTWGMHHSNIKKMLWGTENRLKLIKRKKNKIKT
jgi:glycerol-3-phosphate acyltransferase PlsY